MLKISESEYENLLKVKTETRRSIGIYIGYIISVAGLSGYVLKFVHSKNDDGNGVFEEIVLLVISLIVIALLFEIIWYKFKSHNRYNGYMQLLMQEECSLNINALTDDEKKDQAFIKHYSTLIKDPNKISDSSDNLFSWEYIIARLNNNVFHNLDKSQDEIKDDILESTDYSKFIFSIPDRYDYSWLKKPELLYHDFFENIIHELYKKETFIEHDHPKRWRLRSGLYELFTRFKDLNIGSQLDRRYIISGWRYPRKITQIGTISVGFLFCFLLYKILSNYTSINCPERLLFQRLGCIGGLSDNENILVAILFGISLFIWCYWLGKFVHGIKRLIYGRNSIDYYCWTFFIFRIQKLNSMGLIPVYFSRSFIRFFKNKLIIQYLENKNNVKALKAHLEKKHPEYIACKTCEKRARSPLKMLIALFTKGLQFLKPNNQTSKTKKKKKAEDKETTDLYHLGPCKSYLEIYTDRVRKFQRLEGVQLKGLHRIIVKEANKYGKQIAQKNS